MNLTITNRSWVSVDPRVNQKPKLHLIKELTEMADLSKLVDELSTLSVWKPLSLLRNWKRSGAFRRRAVSVLLPTAAVLNRRRED
jgi:hypothetical protein